MPPGDFSRQNVKAATRLVSSVFTSRNIGFRNVGYEINSKAAQSTPGGLHVLSKIRPFSTTRFIPVFHTFPCQYTRVRLYTTRLCFVFNSAYKPVKLRLSNQ